MASNKLEGGPGNPAAGPYREDMLLELAKDLSGVRKKDDLITFISDRLKDVCHFTHTIVSLIDHSEEIYKPFLLDHKSSPIRDHAEYAALIKTRFTLHEPFIEAVLAAQGAVSFTIAEIRDEPKAPAFLRINHERGSREILMTALWNAEQPVGFIHMYSNDEKGFPQHIQEIITGIAPLLSIAVQNVIRNEELLGKEAEKSFLLDLSSDVAAVRNKEELSEAVRAAFKKIYHLRSYAIRKIDPETATTSLYIYDNTLVTVDESPLLKEVLEDRFPIEDGLQNRVLDSYIPLLFSTNIEYNRGIRTKYLMFWREMGYQWVVGTALRSGDTCLGILWLAIEELNITLLQGICAQISTAMANIMANESLEKSNKDQAVLLRFSNEIAGVRHKKDLEEAIIRVLRDVLDTKLAMINVFNEEGSELIPYIYDPELIRCAHSEERYRERIGARLPSEEPYIARVLESEEPVVFEVSEERRAGDSLLSQFWEQIGVQRAYGALLRVGTTKIGTLWLLADAIDNAVLKGICSQISVAMANILANEKIDQYKRQLEKENVYLKEQIKNIYNFNDIIGGAHEMQKVYKLISLVAESASTVLILGETGTGKELIARAIHNASPRRDRVMIKVNCAAMPANLIETELFGHEKGAFTGAVERRIGKFELANHSTLFLDEIGEMPLEAQVKLLRVLQEKELERIGGKDTIRVDVRIIAATNRNLQEEVNAGRFRSDLYYRLNVFPIHVPALRDRMEDLEPLVNFFIGKYSKNTGKKILRVSSKAIRQLYSYHWPGNIRELEHLIERSVLMADDEMLREIRLPERTAADPESDTPLGKTLEEMERSFIIQALRRCRGKISGPGGAAEAIGIPGNTLHSKMKKLGIGKADYFQAIR